MVAPLKKTVGPEDDHSGRYKTLGDHHIQLGPYNGQLHYPKPIDWGNNGWIPYIDLNAEPKDIRETQKSTTRSALLAVETTPHRST